MAMAAAAATAETVGVLVLVKVVVGSGGVPGAVAGVVAVVCVGGTSEVGENRKWTVEELVAISTCSNQITGTAHTHCSHNKQYDQALAL